MHVRNDHRQNFSLYAFCQLGLYCGVLFGMGVYTARRSRRNLRDSAVILCFGFTFRIEVPMKLARTVISAPRTLETLEDFVVSVL